MSFITGFPKYFRQSVGALLTTVVISILVMAIGFSDDSINPISNAMNTIAFTDTYFYTENKASENSENSSTDINMDIAFIDMSGVYSRGVIAKALSRIADLHPRVVGMDCIFSPFAQADPADNDSLVSAIKRIPNFVAAQRIVKDGETHSIEKSFFSEYCHNASINITDGIVREFSPVEVTELDTTMPSFVGEILRLGYPEKYQMMKERGNEHELINYRRLMFDSYHITDDFEEFDIEDRVILIGDLQDLRDFHDVPVEVDGRMRINGTKIHAYSLSTVTADNRLITNMSDISAFIMGLLITLMFNYLCCWAYDNCQSNGAVVNITQVVLLFILTIVGGLVFINYNYNIQHIYTLAGVGLGAFSTEVWAYIESTKLGSKILRSIGFNVPPPTEGWKDAEVKPAE